MNEEAVATKSSNAVARIRTAFTMPGNERIHQLMLVVSLGVALTLPAMLAVPVWPKIALIVSVLVIATVFGLQVLSLWMQRVLLLPDKNGKVPRWWWLQNTKTRRGYLHVAINIASSLYLLGTGIVLLDWLNETRDWDSFKIGIGPLITGVFLYLFFAFMWGREGGLLDSAFDRSAWIVLVIAIAVGLYAGGVWLGLTQLGKFKVGQAAPWSEQWALVQNTVAQKYPNAALQYVTASREYDAPDSYDAALEEHFDFEQPGGSIVYVIVRDTKPEGTIHMDTLSPGTPITTYSSQDLDKLKSMQSLIQMGPRDALHAALKALGDKAPAPGFPGSPSVTLQIKDPIRGSSKTFDKLGKPVLWEVSLYDKQTPGEINVWIDAQTGQVLLVEQGSG